MGKPRQRTRRSGLASWMGQVLTCHASAVRTPDVRAVHQLRKALRRCRTLASALREVDPAPEWRAMLKASRTLFKALGGLRDTHVLVQWLERLAPADDPTSSLLRYRLNQREVELTAHARTALQAFDRDAWVGSIDTLATSASRHPPGDPLFEQLAMRRLLEAHDLHRRALKGGSGTAWHALRIGIKQLRYAIENFLPDQHARWGDELALLQEVLGDVHDLDVLWGELEAARLLTERDQRDTWHDRLDRVRQARLASYRELMTGPGARWKRWRGELLAPARIEAANRAALAHWGAHHGSEPARAQWLAGRIDALLDALAPLPGTSVPVGVRRLGVSAALLYGLAGSAGRRPTRKRVVRRLARLPLPIGWSEQTRAACGQLLAGLGRRRLEKGASGSPADAVLLAARLLDLLGACAPAAAPLPEVVASADPDGLTLWVTPPPRKIERQRRRLARALGLAVTINPAAESELRCAPTAAADAPSAPATGGRCRD